jgi:hypothetical protein
MTGMDREGHLAYQGGMPMPGLCHCAADDCHDVEPTAPARPEAYGWQQPFRGGSGGSSTINVELLRAGNGGPTWAERHNHPQSEPCRLMCPARTYRPG